MMVSNGRPWVLGTCCARSICNAGAAPLSSTENIVFELPTSDYINESSRKTRFYPLVSPSKESFSLTCMFKDHLRLDGQKSKM